MGRKNKRTYWIEGRKQPQQRGEESVAEEREKLRKVRTGGGERMVGESEKKNEGNSEKLEGESEGGTEVGREGRR